MQRKMERIKWTNKKIAVVLEREGEERIMLELIKKLAGPMTKKQLPDEECSRRNCKREESSRQ